MRVVVFIKANDKTEAGVMPSEKLLAEMGKYNEELVKAGVMLAGEGLHPSSKGARVKMSKGKLTVTDGTITLLYVTGLAVNTRYRLTLEVAGNA